MKRKLKASRLQRPVRLCRSIILLTGFLITWNLSAQYDEEGQYEIRIRQVAPGQSFEKVNEIKVGFDIFYNRDGTEERYLELSEPGDIKIKDFINEKESRGEPVYITGSFKKLRDKSTFETEIPENQYISVLIDRSGAIPESDLINLKSALEKFNEKMPSSSRLYYSMFDEDITESKPVTSLVSSSDFSVTGKKTLLYNAIYTKLLEFDPSSVITNQDIEDASGYRRNRELEKAQDGNKKLIIISNNKDQFDQVSKVTGNRNFTLIWEPMLIQAIELYSGKVDVYAMSIGQEPADSRIFEMICKAGGNPGGYWANVSPDMNSILEVLEKLGTKKSIQDVNYDYEIRYKYKNEMNFQGEKRNLFLELNAQGFKFKTAENFMFKIGEETVQKTTGEKNLGSILLFGLLTGLVVFLLIMIVVQMLIPLIRNRIFIMKYVKKYKPSGNVRYKECPYCGDPLNPGEKVVMKCQHIVHHLCWKDFDHICPEYGQNCNEGKEYFFDISDPFSKKNKIYYLNWVLYGMIGGFITWVFYILLSMTPGFFHSISQWLVHLIRPGISEENLWVFRDKIGIFLIIGLFMGFFMTVLFSYVEEYRHKTWRIYGKILIRGLLGMVAGFVAFFIGSIFLILINRPYLSIFNLIPWTLFGTSIGFIMSLRTTITWKQGVIGGLVSSIFCFLMIFVLARELKSNAILVGFMLYGALLGISIATVKSRSERFFLKIIAGKKNQDVIPVHKWMSSSGGHNEVYIGRAFACEIQMNWEKNNEDIAGKHAKLYINSRGLPVIISLLKDKIVNFNDRFNLDVGKEYQLYNGVKFKIGQTVFQYVESD